MTTLLADGWWFTSAWEVSPVYAISWVAWVVVSIVLHELAHGFAAIRCGDRTPIQTGHMTLNPIVHMGWQSLLLLALAGVAWGAMPVNRMLFRRRHDDAVVSFAGPSTNLSLAIVVVIADALLVGLGPGRISHGLLLDAHTVLFTGGMLNIVLFWINLLPVPPLDGSRIIGSFVPTFRQWGESEQGRHAGLLIYLPIFFFGGRYVYPAAAHIFNWSSEHLQHWMGF